MCPAARRPDYFAALARLVEVMRRTGHLEKVPDYLEKAEKASQRGTTEPGLAFCKALYEWCVGSGTCRDAADWVPCLRAVWWWVLVKSMGFYPRLILLTQFPIVLSGA